MCPLESNAGAMGIAPFVGADVPFTSGRGIAAAAVPLPAFTELITRCADCVSNGSAIMVEATTPLPTEYGGGAKTNAGCDDIGCGGGAAKCVKPFETTGTNGCAAERNGFVP